MDNILLFFTPESSWLWWVQITGAYLSSYLFLWLVLTILTRLPWPRQASLILRVHYYWLLMIALHTILASVLFLMLVQHYKHNGISLWYAAIPLLPLLVNSILVSDLSVRIRERVHQELARKGEQT